MVSHFGEAVPIHYVAVTFTEHGSERTLLFTPVKGEVMLPGAANQIGADWLIALQKAIRVRTGVSLPIGQSDAAKDGFWPAMAKSFLLSLVTTTVIFALLPVILERRLPNRLSEWISGPLVTIFTFVSLLVMRWLRRGPFAVPGEKTQVNSPKWVSVARWTARIFSVLLLAFYGLFILAEGLPPIASQPEGVQFNFIALGLMLLGFIVGWKREGAAALLIASGWTLWQISENSIRWNLFQTPLPVAMLYAGCWWASRGRRTGRVVATALVLVLALGLGRVFVPTNIFIRGVVRDGQSGNAVPDAELRLPARTSEPVGKPQSPHARTGRDGHFTLYVGWLSDQTQVTISAPGYQALTTTLGPRPPHRNMLRDFRLQPARSGIIESNVPPVVVETWPVSGDNEVDSALTELRVTFSQPMRDGNWSWTTWGEENFPEMTGAPRYLADGRTCVLPVKLKPGKLYAIWLNSESQKNFTDINGKSAMPYLLIFETRK